MKIISSIALDGRSAGSWYAIETAKRLQARGHEILFVPRPRGQTIDMARDAGLDVVDDIDLEIKSLGAMRRNLSRLRKLLSEHRPDVVLAHWGEDHSFWGLAKTFSSRKPVLIRVRALDPKPPKRHPLSKWLHHRPTDIVVTVNSTLYTAYQTRLNLSPDKVRIIEGGIDPAQYADAAAAPQRLAELGISANGPVIVLLARFSPIKGHRILLSAMARVRDKHPNAHFLWLGLPSEYNAGMFKRWFVEGNLLDAVTVIDEFQDNLPELLMACQVGLVTSVGSESVSRSLLEYFACGLSAVATEVGGIPDLMRRGDFGVLVPPEQPRALADGICRLLDDRDYGRACGHSAREYVMQNCTWDQRVDEWETLLNESVHEVHNRP
jgi:glycosyltransferase involved in cell wall biosynthesis